MDSSEWSMRYSNDTTQEIKVIKHSKYSNNINRTIRSSNSYGSLSTVSTVSNTSSSSSNSNYSPSNRSNISNISNNSNNSNYSPNNNSNISTISNDNYLMNDVKPSNKNQQIIKQEKEQWKISNFQIGKQLGTGKFSRVYLAREKQSKKICALKILNKSQLQRTFSSKWQELLRREIEIQHHFRHKNITRLWGYFFDEQRVYLIMEYCKGGTLHSLLKTYGCFHEYIVANWALKILDALIYCHKRNVIHRDLKLENILYLYCKNKSKSVINHPNDLKNLNVKIADFGFSAVLNGDRRYTFCGTLDYLAPEAIMSEQIGYDTSVDIWSLGIIIYELIVGKSPFFAPNAFKTFQKIQKLDYQIPTNVSKQAKDLIQSLLKLDPKKRLKLSIARQHPFFQKYLHYH
eukprot:283257_1